MVPGNFYGHRYICKSGYWAEKEIIDEYGNPKIQRKCAPAPISIGLPKNDHTSCYVEETTYDGEVLQKEEETHCGFNTEDHSYCNSQIGDSGYQGMLARLEDALKTNYRCHVSSMPDTCADFIEKNTKLALEFRLWNYKLTKGANIAHNAECLKDTLFRFVYGFETSPAEMVLLSK